MCQEITGAGWGCFVQTGSSGTSTSGSSSGVTSGATASTSGGSSESMSGMALPPFGPGGSGVSSSGALDDGSSASAQSDGGSFSPCSDSDGGCTVWTGYLENYHLLSGSDVVTLEMQLPQGPGTVTGSVVFGQGPLLAPPTDPNVGFPPITPPKNAIDCGPFRYTGDALEYFPFTIEQGAFDGARLTFTLDSNEIFKQWCELQTVIFPANSSPPGYWCAPSSYQGCNCAPSGCSDTSMLSTSECYSDPTTGKLVPIECGKMELCVGGSYCTCTSSHCTENVAMARMISFDMQVQSDRADGSVAFTPSTIINVHLTRQATGEDQ
jgi:hypothetical protein